MIDNPGGFLTPGLFGHMRLRGAQPYAALLVPDQALATDQTREVVYVVDSQGLVHERDVVLGPLFEGLRIIRRGLAPGDRVVIDGVQRAKPGQAVAAATGQIKPLAPAAAVAPDDIATPAETATLVDADH